VLHAIARAALSSRASLGLTKKRVDMFVVASDAKELSVITRYGAECASLSLALRVVGIAAGSAGAGAGTGAGSAAASAAAAQIPPGCITTVISQTMVMHLPVAVRQPHCVCAPRAVWSDTPVVRVCIACAGV